jgi:hypothetical protein
MTSNYSPKSYFYVDQTQLSALVSSDAATDAFGPITYMPAGGVTPLSDKFRTTTIVRASVNVKVFAICKGRLLIQPMNGDTTKVNLILKPDTSVYSPLKIKYFIYRGVNKADLISSDTELAPKSSNPFQPAFLNKLWDYFNGYYAQAVPQPVFPPFAIGYDPSLTGVTLLDKVFNSKTNDYMIPNCTEGEHIGNFTGTLGLDIVLDEGDSALEGEPALFNFDLNYARKAEHWFDHTTESDPNRKKIYKDYIQQFIDAASFWGSHVNSGLVKFTDIPSGTGDAGIIYDKALLHYHTKDKVYFYIKEQEGRSYGFFYNAFVSLALEQHDGATDAYETYGWPIAIKSYTPSNGQSNVFCVLGTNIASSIIASDRRLGLDVIFPGNDTKNYPILYENYNSGAKPIKSDFKIQLHNNIPCATFAFIFGYLNQTPLLLGPPVRPQNYYDGLWPFNLAATFALPPSTSDIAYTVNFEKSRMTNLAPIANYGAIIQNRLFFDNGKNTAGTSVPRRLYLATITSNTTHDIDQNDNNKLNVDKDISGLIKNPNSLDAYIKAVYNDSDFTVYKNTFLDNAVSINGLALVNEKNFRRKAAYFHLGISDDQYHTLYQSLPGANASDKYSLYFHLEPVALPESPASKGDLLKFKLGIRYLLYSQNLTTDSIPAYSFSFPSSDIYIYTLDGYYFFSKEYSDHHQFSKEFAVSEVRFRPRQDWKGEFGFDWIRVGDTLLSGDSISPVDRSFIKNIGHYYAIDASGNSIGVKCNPGTESSGLPSGATSVKFFPEIDQFLKLRNTFCSYPKTGTPGFITAQYSMYSGAWLSIYPSANNAGALPFPKTSASNTKKCLTEAALDLKIEIANPPTRLRVKFEKQFFSVVSDRSGDTTLDNASSSVYSYLEIKDKTTTGTTPRSIRIKVHSLFESSIDRKIEVLAVENGVEKQAGVMWVMANSQAYRKEINVNFVNFATNLSFDGLKPDGTNNYYTLNGLRNDADKQILLDGLNRSLNQALIDINVFSLYPPPISNTFPAIDLTRGADPVFYNTFKNTTVAEDFVNMDFLEDKEDATYPLYFRAKVPTTLFVNSLVAFIVADEVIKSFVRFTSTQYTMETLAGIAQDIGKPCLVVFGTGTPGLTDRPPGQSFAKTPSLLTIAHEAGHSLGLHHTFENESDFTFRQYNTDLLMDYVQVAISPTFQIGFNKFQWYKIRRHDIILNSQ